MSFLVNSVLMPHAVPSTGTVFIFYFFLINTVTAVSDFVPLCQFVAHAKSNIGPLKRFPSVISRRLPKWLNSHYTGYLPKGICHIFLGWLHFLSDKIHSICESIPHIYLMAFLQILTCQCAAFALLIICCNFLHLYKSAVSATADKQSSVLGATRQKITSLRNTWRPWRKIRISNNNERNKHRHKQICFAPLNPSIALVKADRVFAMLGRRCLNDFKKGKIMKGGRKKKVCIYFPSLCAFLHNHLLTTVCTPN